MKSPDGNGDGGNQSCQHVQQPENRHADGRVEHTQNHAHRKVGCEKHPVFSAARTSGKVRVVLEHRSVVVDDVFHGRLFHASVVWVNSSWTLGKRKSVQVWP